MRDDARLRAVLLALLLASMFSCALAAARVLYTGRAAYAFLGWNMVLAWVPLGLSLALDARHRPGRRPGRLGSAALGAAWLVFLPNAPYMVTDLLHLRPHGWFPFWFDVVMVFSFALTGLCIAFTSLLLVHRLVARWRGRAAGWLFVTSVAGLTGFGVYLGRFQRWNSWDVVTRPEEIVAGLAGGLLHPLAHARPIGLTIVMGGLFAISYLMLFTLASLGSAIPAREELAAADRAGLTSPARRL
jgi:uncharacterized membrane protein